MKTEELFTDALCSYDPRSTDYQDMLLGSYDGDASQVPPPRTGMSGKGACYCDNCFKGRDDLAVAGLKLLRALEGVVRVADRKTDEFDAAREAMGVQS